MVRPTCAPRLQNVLDIAEGVISLGRIDRVLMRRFQMMRALDAQRGAVDHGMGLCGKRGSFLAQSITDVTCPECLQLIGRLEPR